MVQTLSLRDADLRLATIIGRLGRKKEYPPLVDPPSSLAITALEMVEEAKDVVYTDPSGFLALEYRKKLEELEFQKQVNEIIEKDYNGITPEMRRLIHV